MTQVSITSRMNNYVMVKQWSISQKLKGTNGTAMSFNMNVLCKHALEQKKQVTEECIWNDKIYTVQKHRKP